MEHLGIPLSIQDTIMADGNTEPQHLLTEPARLEEDENYEI
jgi:hypothetical protein